MPDTLDRLLQAYAELTVRVGLNVQKGQRLHHHRAARQRRRVARSRAPRPPHRGERVSGRSAARRSRLGRRTVAARRGSATRHPRHSPILHLVAEGAGRACRRRARRALDLRQRSGSAEERTDRTRGCAPAGRVALRSPVPGIDFPQRDELGGDRGGRAGLGRESVSVAARRISGSRASGTKSAASAGWIVPIRWRRGTHISKALAARADYLEQQAVPRAEVHAVPART